MKSVKALALATIFILLLAGLAAAKTNQFGVADKQVVTFSETIHVGTAVLPAGEYDVKHTMEGDNHIMVFTQVGVKSPVEAHVKCNLVKLQAKADHTSQLYDHDATNQHVLRELTFKGDTAKHVF
jgi:hypothetical protein